MNGDGGTVLRSATLGRRPIVTATSMLYAVQMNVVAFKLRSVLGLQEERNVGDAECVDV